MKIYQYRAVVISDRGHIDDPVYLRALNEQGAMAEAISCPICGESAHCGASGWKHREEQIKGADKLVILLEREVEFHCPTIPGT